MRNWVAVLIASAVGLVAVAVFAIAFSPNRPAMPGQDDAGTGTDAAERSAAAEDEPSSADAQPESDGIRARLATVDPSGAVPTPFESDYRLLMTFDNGESLAAQSRVVDSSPLGNHGTVLGTQDGVIRTVSIEETNAARFPEPCKAGTCPSAIIEIPDHPSLQPGLSSFTWGARVLMHAAETTKGSNLLQKGLHDDPGGQWKLQVDGREGRPSCVVSSRGDGSHQRASVKSSVSIADGQWHSVECARTPAAVLVVIDGIVRGETAVSPMALSNTAPVRVGGKYITDDDNDQFHGLLDDVFVRVG